MKKVEKPVVKKENKENKEPKMKKILDSLWSISKFDRVISAPKEKRIFVKDFERGVLEEEDILVTNKYNIFRFSNPSDVEFLKTEAFGSLQTFKTNDMEEKGETYEEEIREDVEMGEPEVDVFGEEIEFTQGASNETPFTQ